MRKRIVLVGLLLVAGGCRCGTVINPVELGFRTTTTEVDFGRVLEGTTASRSLTLTAETRAAVTVSVSAAPGPPFDAPDVVEVPGGGQVELLVRFTARSVEESGTLTLSANETSVTIPLHGVGVRPPVCIPSAPCRTSTYSLEEDRCVEVEAPDNAPCDPGSLCLEQGRCRAGACLGVARSCNDNDECTIDGCATESGCVHTPRSCPPPTAPCHVATCDPRTGCGEGPAADGTPCGTIDCVSAHLCFSGACLTVATPEGFQCSAPVACIGRGECHSQRCVRPDAGPWLPNWSARLAVVPSSEPPVLLSSVGNLFFTACGLPTPAPDGGDDAGLDGGTDGGLDGGPDGGEADAGEADGGDGGADGGAAGDGGSCGLVSYTSSGFNRFEVPFADGAARRPLSVGPRGVLVLADGGLELRSRVTGGVLTALPARDLLPRAVASRLDGTFAVAVPLPDGGTSLVAWGLDGGAEELVSLPLAGPLLAVDEGDTVHLWEPGGRLGRLRPGPDGGPHLELVVVDAGLPSLALARGAIAAGLAQLVVWDEDGGIRALPFDWSDGDGGTREPLVREVLLSPDTLVVFYRQCEVPVTSCLDSDKSTWARAVDSRTGALLWESAVLPAGISSWLAEAALVDLSPYTRGGVVTLVRAELDAGVRAYAQLFGGGQRLVICPLPEESRDVRGGLFAGSQMLVVVARSDGGMALEAYSIAGLPLQTAGWPQADGLNGERLETP